jgi:hypothetical protein
MRDGRVGSEINNILNAISSNPGTNVNGAVSPEAEAAREELSRIQQSVVSMLQSENFKAADAHIRNLRATSLKDEAPILVFLNTLIDSSDTLDGMNAQEFLRLVREYQESLPENLRIILMEQAKEVERGIAEATNSDWSNITGDTDVQLRLKVMRPEYITANLKKSLVTEVDEEESVSVTTAQALTSAPVSILIPTPVQPSVSAPVQVSTPASEPVSIAVPVQASIPTSAPVLTTAPAPTSVPVSTQTPAPALVPAPTLAKEFDKTKAEVRTGLVNYINRIKKHNFDHEFHIFAKMRAVNREANLKLAEQLLIDIDANMDLKTAFADVKAKRVHAVGATFFKDKGYRNNGINSCELNNVIKLALKK